MRLRYLEVGCIETSTGPCINTLHMAAQHPDIQVKTLNIWSMCGIEKIHVYQTLHDDMKALLQIPTLTDLSLPSRCNFACRTPGNKFLPIIAQILPKCHLAAIEELDLGESNFLELPSDEMKHFFQSIFSLPRLSWLTLNMTNCVVSFHHYKLINHLWTQHSSGKLLKKLVIGNTVLMSKKEYSSRSVRELMSLLESIAQSTSVVNCPSHLIGLGLVLAKADLIEVHLEITDWID